MNWYYAEAGQQKGPVNDEQLDQLVRDGTVEPTTLVWHEGLANWAPIATVRPNLPPQAPPLSPAPEPALPPGHVLCSECRKAVSANEVVQIGNATVCAACKPIYVQKLREGAATLSSSPISTMRYAGFWIRFVAKFIDGIIVGVPLMAMYLVAGFFMGVGMNPGAGGGGAPNMSALMASMGLQLLVQVVSIVLSGVYNVFFITKYSATPGKMATGLRVVMADGERLTFGRAVGRYFAEMVSAIACYIGYIIAGFDEQKRSLHDHICSTRVVYK